MRSVSRKVIYSASVLWKVFDFERRIGASESFKHRKNGGNTHSAK